MTNTNKRSGDFGDNEKLGNTSIIKNFQKFYIESGKSFAEEIS